MTQEQYRKLPKYIQEYIHNQSMEIEKLKQQINILKSKYNNSNIKIHSTTEIFNIPDESIIEIQTQTGIIQVQLSLKKETVKIYGEEILYVLPTANNSIQIKPLKTFI